MQINEIKELQQKTNVIQNSSSPESDADKQK